MNDLKSEAFELSRAYLRPTTYYQPGKIEMLHPLGDAVASGRLGLDVPLLVMEIDGTAIAFVTMQLVYHHVMQGVYDNQPWLVSFCSVCNGGAAFSPVVDGQVYTFQERGFYDAMILLNDQQTDSYWDHLRGICLYGSSEGKQLRRLSNLLHTTVRQVLTSHPTALLAMSELTPDQATEGLEDDLWRIEDEPEWSQRLLGTLRLPDDDRLPRLSIGLGVWQGKASRYYPISALYIDGGAVIDEFQGRRILVYVNPENSTPSAFFTEAKTLRWEREVLILDTGERVQDGVVLDKDGRVRGNVERPLQLFTRWYGFAVKFAGCEIYQAKNTD